MFMFHFIFSICFPALFYSKVPSQLKYRCRNRVVFNSYINPKINFKNNSYIIIDHRSSDFISWPKRARFVLIREKSFSVLFPAFLQSYWLLIHSSSFSFPVKSALYLFPIFCDIVFSIYQGGFCRATSRFLLFFSPFHFIVLSNSQNKDSVHHTELLISLQFCDKLETQ